MNLKLEMTDYSQKIYGLRGLAYPGGYDDDDGGGGGGGDSDGNGDLEETPSFQPRKRSFW